MFVNYFLNFTLVVKFPKTISLHPENPEGGRGEGEGLTRELFAT